MVGHLTALGDTKFIMYVNGCTHWLGYILPVYVLVTYYEAGAITGWTIIALNALIVAAIYKYRTRSVSTAKNPELVQVRIPVE